MARKKRFVVKPRTARVMEKGLSTTKGTIGFGGKTQKILTDESLAREIDSEYGIGGSGKRDVYVYEDERLEWHDEHDKQTDGMNHDAGGHRYFFGSGGNFSKAWEAFEKRRKDKHETKKEASRVSGSAGADRQKGRRKSGSRRGDPGSVLAPGIGSG